MTASDDMDRKIAAAIGLKPTIMQEGAYSEDYNIGRVESWIEVWDCDEFAFLHTKPYSTSIDAIWPLFVRYDLEYDAYLEITKRRLLQKDTRRAAYELCELFLELKGR